MTAASYSGKTCAPDSVNIVETPCARATSSGVDATVRASGGVVGVAVVCGHVSGYAVPCSDDVRPGY